MTLQEYMKLKPRPKSSQSKITVIESSPTSWDELDRHLAVSDERGNSELSDGRLNVIQEETSQDYYEMMDHKLALSLQEEENELAEHNVLEKQQHVDYIRSGRSAAREHFWDVNHHHNLNATSPHFHHHYRNDTAQEAQDIYRQETKLRSEKVHRCLRSSHGYL